MNTKDDVKKFMLAGDQIVRDYIGDGEFMAQADLYMALVEEEFKELRQAFLAQDLVGIADGCADLKWVIEGLEHTLGLPQQAVWDEVARSNHSKSSESGKMIKRADGKILKPDTYSPPNIKKILIESDSSINNDEGTSWSYRKQLYQ